jgi:hypothetical protein
MNTGPGQHRHLDSRGKWTTDRDPHHVHSVDLSQYVTKAEFDALVARVAALETVRAFSFKTA